MCQNLVHDDLEEKRSYERKQLDEKRGQKDMTECAPVSEQRRQEPAEAETFRRRAGTDKAALDENKGTA
ncbi:hypothetical protein GCM10011491_43160 [Brucella endophytica]|uniref:Uncharacterized protein n=1 Tax=Brucella endophytica TaxID=1963359 RepID=A0A916SPQ2_9HYPH|nr:hypothetical protein GCM10011491_43160 [Brucella endophytica]